MVKVVMDKEEEMDYSESLEEEVMVSGHQETAMVTTVVAALQEEAGVEMAPMVVVAADKVGTRHCSLNKNHHSSDSNLRQCDHLH